MTVAVTGASGHVGANLRVIDDSRARRDLGQSPRPLEETIADPVEQMMADARPPVALLP